MKIRNIIFYSLISLLFVSCNSSKFKTEISNQSEVYFSETKEYFENRGMKYPLNIQKSIYNKKITLEEETELSQTEKNAIEKFMNYIIKNLSIEQCKTWNKRANAFSLSDLGIIEDSNRKCFKINVTAYYENVEAQDRIINIPDTNITSLYNIILFDADTYEALGWMF